MSNFLQLSVKLLVCGNRKLTKRIFPFTSFFPLFSENFSDPKASFLLFVFFLMPSTST